MLSKLIHQLIKTINFVIIDNTINKRLVILKLKVILALKFKILQKIIIPNDFNHK